MFESFAELDVLGVGALIMSVLLLAALIWVLVEDLPLEEEPSTGSPADEGALPADTPPVPIVAIAPAGVEPRSWDEPVRAAPVPVPAGADPAPPAGGESTYSQVIAPTRPPSRRKSPS